jgi:hypothetical protein
MMTTRFVASLLPLFFLAGCGAAGATPESESVAEDRAELGCTCPTEKLSFSRAKGCENDGSVEFCIPKDDAALRARLDGLGVKLTYLGSAGRARCDVQRETLVQFPTEREDRHVCTADGALRRTPWAQLCTIAREPAVKAIVPTFYE